MLVALFRLFSFFPLFILHAIGAVMGWVVYLLSPAYRRLLNENIQQAGFAGYTRQAISEAGKNVFELPFIWFASSERVLKAAKITNWDVVEAAMAQQQGVLLLTPHLGCFEIIAQSIASKTPVTVLYRPPRKKSLQPLMGDGRKRDNMLLAPANLSGVRSMLKTLKSGGAVGLLPDQVPQQGEGVWTDFFGRPAYTMTLPAKMHSMTGAPIILSYAQRLSWGRGYLVKFIAFEQLISEPLTGTPEQQANTINLAMEKLIAYCPEQYFWSYNRYKVPPNVDAPIAKTPTIISAETQ